MPSDHLIGQAVGISYSAYSITRDVVACITTNVNGVLQFRALTIIRDYADSTRDDIPRVARRAGSVDSQAGAERIGHSACT